MHHTIEIGAGATAISSTSHALQEVTASVAGGIGYAHHAIHHLWYEGWFHAWSADAFHNSIRAFIAARIRFGTMVVIVENGPLRVDHAQIGARAVVAEVATDGGTGAACAGTHHDPFRRGVFFHFHLAEDAFGDVVIATPIGSDTGVGELIHVIAIGLMRQLVSGIIHIARILHEMALATVKGDGIDLCLRR